MNTLDISKTYLAEKFRTEGRSEGRTEGREEGRTEGRAEGVRESILTLGTRRLGEIST